MGIYADIQEEVTKAMDTDLADAAVPLTLIQVYSEEYNTTTGTPRTINIETETRGFVVPIDTSKIDGEAIKVGDVQFLILDSMLHELPEIDDVIHHGGEDYKIVSINKDSAEATWLIQGRTT